MTCDTNLLCTLYHGYKVRIIMFTVVHFTKVQETSGEGLSCQEVGVLFSLILGHAVSISTTKTRVHQQNGVNTTTNRHLLRHRRRPHIGSSSGCGVFRFRSLVSCNFCFRNYLYNNNINLCTNEKWIDK